jgi:aminopeptidase YwaD
MKHVGVAALVTAYLLTNANEQTAIDLIKDVEGSALQRLQIEYDLSEAILKQGGDKAKEDHIQEVWRDWYINGLATATNIPLDGARKKTRKAIANAQKDIRDKTNENIQKLGN